MAPEGSAVRANSRKVLLRMTRLALHEECLSADCWLEVLVTSFPHLVESVSERDLEAIIALSMRSRR
jgi:hypothetical protein